MIKCFYLNHKNIYILVYYIYYNNKQESVPNGIECQYCLISPLMYVIIYRYKHVYK